MTAAWRPTPDRAEPLREPVHQDVGHGEAQIGKRIGNTTKALRCPPQRTLGASPNVRLHKRIMRLLKVVLNLDRRLGTDTVQPRSQKLVSRLCRMAIK